MEDLTNIAATTAMSEMQDVLGFAQQTLGSHGGGGGSGPTTWPTAPAVGRLGALDKVANLETCPRGFFAPGDKFSRGHAPPAFLAQHFCPRGFFAPEACRGVGFSFQTKLKNGGQSLDLSYQCAQSKQQVSHS